MTHALFSLATLTVLVAMHVSMATVQATKMPGVSDSLNTTAGELKIVEQEPFCRYAVMLGEKVLLQTNCQAALSKDANMPIPTIHTYYKPGVRPFDEVVLFQQQMQGNACNGGPLWFIGLRHDGSYVLSERIDFCGGRQPIVTWEADKVTLVLPGGPPNRGIGYIPAETWVYENGQVQHVVEGTPRQ